MSFVPSSDARLAAFLWDRRVKTSERFIHGSEISWLSALPAETMEE
jgi:hypothetical protein